MPIIEIIQSGIYEIQEKGNSFPNLEEMLHIINKETCNKP